MYNYTAFYTISSRILELTKLQLVLLNFPIKRYGNPIERMLTKFIKVEKKLHLIDSIKISISTLKDYVSYTFTNTPTPPLNNVPKRGSSL